MTSLKASTALALVLAFGLANGVLPAAAQQQQQGAQTMQCDLDGDGLIAADEARACAEQQFGEMRGDEDYVTEERFVDMYGGGADMQDTFAQVDEDGDGQISTEEWASWRERSFVEATGDAEGMSVDEYDQWLRGNQVTGDTVDSEGAKMDTSSGDQPGSSDTDAGGSDTSN